TFCEGQFSDYPISQFLNGVSFAGAEAVEHGDSGAEFGGEGGDAQEPVTDHDAKSRVEESGGGVEALSFDGGINRDGGNQDFVLLARSSAGRRLGAEQRGREGDVNGRNGNGAELNGGRIAFGNSGQAQ